MCYVFRTPLFPAQLLLARQFDLSVTSIPQSVSRWRHNEYSWCSHPLHFVQALNTPVVKVRLVVWRSDLTGQGVDYTHRDNTMIYRSYRSSHQVIYLYKYNLFYPYRMVISRRLCLSLIPNHIFSTMSTCISISISIPMSCISKNISCTWSWKHPIFWVAANLFRSAPHMSLFKQNARRTLACFTLMLGQRRRRWTNIKPKQAKVRRDRSEAADTEQTGIWC